VIVAWLFFALFIVLVVGGIEAAFRMVAFRVVTSFSHNKQSTASGFTLLNGIP
jgi:hypothetical protein